VIGGTVAWHGDGGFTENVAAGGTPVARRRCWKAENPEGVWSNVCGRASDWPSSAQLAVNEAAAMLTPTYN